MIYPMVYRITFDHDQCRGSMTLMRLIPMIGQKFGRLTVVEKSPVQCNDTKWECICDCGKRCTVRGHMMRSGKTSSCGCFGDQRRVEYNTTHGHSGTPTYRSWQHMMERCYDEDSKNWHRYGGRGITVCDRWRNSFENFLEDMGIKPSGTTIDRINNDGNYGPENCRWADKWQQAWNTSQNKRITYNGESKCLHEWAFIYDVSFTTLRTRLGRGWTMDQAVSKEKRPNPCKGRTRIKGK